MERQAPRQIMYENQLPLAIESKSQRRLFFPEGGSTYGPTSNGAHPNIIRIPINADSLLDVQHSYLQFKINNKTAGCLGLDIGVPFIRRLRIESAGTTLEDIEEYGKLYGGVLFPVQASTGAVADASITTGGIGGSVGALSAIAAVTAPACAMATAEVAAAAAGAGGEGAFNGKIDAAIVRSTANIRTSVNARTASTGIQHNATNQLNAGESLTYNIPLVSALMNMSKYLPLVMMNAGLTLEIELDTTKSAGCFNQTNNTAGVGQEPTAVNGEVWTISDVRYVAHLIDLQRDFYDKMRMVMEGSGGVLQLAGTTFRHYGASNPQGTEVTVNIPSRVKSIKSVLFTQSDSLAKDSATTFGVSNSIPNGLTEYQFRVGSVVYPATSVKANVGALGSVANSYTNRGEVYSELRKAFGTLGDYSEGGLCLSKETYLQPGSAAFTDAAAAAAVAPQPRFAPFALDFESFPKTALESGVNTADRSLPMSLEIKQTGIANTCNVDVWVMCDAIFYVNLDGSVSVSI